MTDPESPSGPLVETFPISHVINPHENPTVNPKDGSMKVVGVPVAVVSNGAQLIDLKPFFDKYRTKPETRKGVLIITGKKSFAEIINRFKNPATSVIFAQSGEIPRLVCIFDYHPEGSDITATGAAEFRVELVGPAINKNLIKFIVDKTGLPVFYGEIP